MFSSKEDKNDPFKKKLSNFTSEKELAGIN